MGGHGGSQKKVGLIMETRNSSERRFRRSQNWAGWRGGGESWVSQRDKGGKRKGLKKEMGGQASEESFRQVYLSTRGGGVGSRQLELRIKR